MSPTAFDHSGGAFSPPFVHLQALGWALEHHARIDSTNAEAHRRIAGGLAAKTAIVADSQTAGSGRQARVWESSAPNGLWVSLVLPLRLPPETLPQSTLVLAVAVREALAQSCGVELGIKWPNDLLYEGRKCCGLLVESACFAQLDMPKTTPLILGVGVNLNHEPEDFPPQLRDSATSLRGISGCKHNRATVLEALVSSVGSWFDRWVSHGFAPVREAWLQANCTLGKRISLPQGYGHTLAAAYDLAPDGALVALADSGEILRIDAGEIVLSHAASPAAPPLQDSV